MRRLLWTVATVCLLQATVLSFVLVPIKVQAFPPLGQSPAVWLILDSDFMLKTLPCFGAPEPARCFAEIGEIFAFVPRLGIRIVICFLAVVSGVFSFRLLYKQPDPQ